MMKSISFCALLSLAVAQPTIKRQAPPGVPPYVVDYAPMVYLYSGDPYRPSDIGAQLSYTQPEVNFTVVKGAPNPLTLDNLSSLNSLGGKNVYLTSIQDPSKNPSYLLGVTPDSNGKTNGAVSCAIIVNDHGSGLVDAFYMYFYAFNYGGSYGVPDFTFIVDDHVGDWEHNMVRFQNGKPTAVWYSQHANGQAFTYDAVQKYNHGVRPVVFSANGSHANYAVTGTHDHSIPNLNLPIGPVEDFTDMGPVWDPTASAYYYTYTPLTNVTGTFAAYDNASSTTPVDWLQFVGEWGDAEYPKSDPRQSYGLGIEALAKWTGGPTGPEDKQLNRTQVCPVDGEECILRTILGP